MQLVKKMPIVHVDGNIARNCGGRQDAGHPQVYYQLDTRDPSKPVTCKWSGIRFMKSDHH